MERNETCFGAALDAASEVRQEPGEPEELQLEGEDERVERGPARLRIAGVQSVEEPGQRQEGAVVVLFLGEQLEHGLEPDEAHLEAVRISSDGVVRPYERGAGDRSELTTTPMDGELDVRERLEPAAEAALRPAHPLCDHAQASARVRVDVEDAIRLAERECPEDDRLRDRRRSHGPSVGLDLAVAAALARHVGGSVDPGASVSDRSQQPSSS